MHKVFGLKENFEYTDREGAYLIPIRNNQVGVIKIPKGYFFLGGGLEKGESHLDCIKRECIEEAGFRSEPKEKICSAEMFFKHPRIGYFHPIQTYYFGELLEKITEPIENDHVFLWMDIDEIRGKMYLEMQNWALEKALSNTFEK